MLIKGSRVFYSCTFASRLFGLHPVRQTDEHYNAIYIREVSSFSVVFYLFLIVIPYEKRYSANANVYKFENYFYDFNWL